MKGLVLLTLAAAMCTICGRPNTSNAATLTSNYQDRSSQLERRVSRMENEMNRMQRALEQFHHRISRLEQKSDDDRRDPRPPRDVQHVCMLVDSGRTKTFLGKANTQIDAKFEVKSECEKSVHTSYCQLENVKCDSTLDNPRSSKYTCVLVDTGRGKAFRGEGITQVEAEGHAKQSCQSSVHSSYCGNTAVTCEASYN